MTAYRLHDYLGQGWIEIPMSEIQALGLQGRISSRSRISPDGQVLYVHEHEDLKTYIAARKIRPEQLPLDEDVVMRSPVGGFPEYQAPESAGEKTS